MTDSTDVWAAFTHDPRDPQYAVLRASDQDRTVVQQVLAEAYADGRLDREEYDERSDRVGSTRALGDLGPLLLDLVPAPDSTAGGLARASRSELEDRAVRAWRSRRREAVFSFLGPSLVCLVIWFATSWEGGDFQPTFFWPVFVIVFTGLHLVRTVARRSEIIDEEVRRLERKRAKELRAPDRPRGEASE